MATGEWSAIFNPVSQWDNSYTAILSINNFMRYIDIVPWKPSIPEMHTMFIRRFYGEAYALRGLFEYQLLQTCAGVGADGQLLGIPLLTEFPKVDDNFNVRRATFDESVAQIYADLDKALEYLTMDDYVDITNASQLPTGLQDVNITNYNLVFGSVSNQRISGRIVKALKARVALLAASPAFTIGVSNKTTLWEAAANFAGAAMILNGGIAGLDPNGHKFYEAARVNAINLANKVDQKEMLWRKAIYTSNSREVDNYPPSLYGYGSLNPTQNLIDAFPDENGYPISHASTVYSSAAPYVKRDPRLKLYIAYNGCSMRSTTINTGVGGGTNAKDSIQTSTRTGYYLRKLLREDVNLNPASLSSALKHYDPIFRYTELFLIYSEAANEAWGPTGTGTIGFSAKDVIRAIRNRAGIIQPDNYLNSITSTDDMRELIRNERRIELCFEGFRFWDLRRWNVDLTESARGVNINKASTIFNVVDVESRTYNNDFMHYGPIPQGEINKFSSLIQNNGW